MKNFKIHHINYKPIINFFFLFLPVVTAGHDIDALLESFSGSLEGEVFVPFNGELLQRTEETVAAEMEMSTTKGQTNLSCLKGFDTFRRSSFWPRHESLLPVNEDVCTITYMYL